jgi:hypothetical protein
VRDHLVQLRDESLIALQQVSAMRCCIVDVSFHRERPLFKDQSAENPFTDRDKVGTMMTILTSAERTKFTVTASGVSSAQYGEIAAFVLFLYFLSIAQSPNASADFGRLMAPATRSGLMTCFLGLGDEYFFRGYYSRKPFGEPYPKCLRGNSEKIHPKLSSNGSDYMQFDCNESTVTCWTIEFSFKDINSQNV